MLKRISNWLKKYFIPHEGNEHKPHFLRREAALVILSVVLVSELIFLLQITFVLPRSSFFGEVLSSVISFETNKARAENSVQSIKINPLLSEAAQLKADDMVKNSYFAHTSPEGITSWYWFKKVGYEYIYAGENLAINFFESKEVVEAWMKSPAHRENILDKKFTELGIGIATGTYEGRQAVFVVQMFGKPLEKNNVPVVVSQIAVFPTNEQLVAQPNAPQQVLAVTDQADQKVKGVSALAEFLTSPKIVSNFFFAALLTIIGIALILKIGIKIKVQYPPLIVNGVLLILIISSVILFNQYFVFYGTKLV